MKIIKGILISILVLIFIQIQGQNIHYQLYGKYICNDSIFLVDIYTLEQLVTGAHFLGLEEPLCLPDTGIYKLKSSHLHPSDTITIRVNNWGLNSDTILVLSVYKAMYFRSDKKDGWSCCNTTCEGYYTDYYNNGNKRMEGRFRKGKPIGIFVYYDVDGSLESIYYYDKKGKSVESKYFH